ncbi:HrpA-like helicase [Encephalitozoon intestinalis ATCC 50506]|uniref:HrpA-like helicase n=1 Tax=Encephalitozoon intestinalis (strain ATCC 50506) TaxID=876142 RepID=E0SAE8_ENCIT|nr:HrpA-like helicase [Encephalitozoon intestinalis ATCC 50506]ADM12573.1 HrpA-like helicase [Encephalitozoon intestinalis ATCC 50506]UTX46429.1 putative pre-MRNA-splicing factor RNA helicase DHX16 [Encephalitozoon intestinalis]
MEERTVFKGMETEIRINREIPPELFPLAKDKKDSIAEEEIMDLLISTEKKEERSGEESVKDKMGEIFSKLEKSQVLLIEGDTGCGKTTKVPRYLLERYKSIVCTQPRRIAAVSVAKKVAQDMNVKIGMEVGYSVRFNDVSSKKTRLKYATDGILLREIVSDKCLNRYDVVIIDEAHERSVNIDILLGYLKSILSKRKDLRVIIMSATLSSEKFISFFRCQTVEIRHRMFPLEIFFLKKAGALDYLDEAVKTVVQIHRTEEEGDILVFLTGKEEINNGRNILVEILGNDAEVYCIYSMLSPEEQELVFKKTKKRKIVLATNIAETSITIEGIKYVVDCGRAKQMRYSGAFGMDILEVAWISKAQAKQRAGRAGRTQEGKVFRLYSKEEFQEMSENTIPEIFCCNLAKAVLELKSIGVNDIVNFDLIDKPDTSNVRKALELLYYLKAIGGDGKITPIGARASKIPLEPELAISLIVSSDLGCLEDVSIIAAMLSVGNIWLDIPKYSQSHKAFLDAKSLYFDRRGDHFSFLKIYRMWERTGFKISHLKRSFLNVRAMLQTVKIKKQLCSMFNGPCKSDESKIVLSFCAGYFMNVAKLVEGSSYVSIFNDTQFFVHNTSCMSRKRAKYILYHSLCRTGREFVRCCVEVTLEDLLKGANHMFSKVEKDLDRC